VVLLGNHPASRLKYALGTPPNLGGELHSICAVGLGEVLGERSNISGIKLGAL